jgi:nitrite reductase/ring-hydroxylating ferredoxin subunit
MTQATAGVLVTTMSELGAAKRVVVDIGGVEVLVILTTAGVVAVRNACTHLGLSLQDGRLIAGQIHCPFHGACFDLRTGEAISGPAVAPLQRFPVRVEGDQVYVSPNDRT